MGACDDLCCIVSVCKRMTLRKERVFVALLGRMPLALCTVFARARRVLGVRVSMGSR